jgi:hypothetical protein
MWETKGQQSEGVAQQQIAFMDDELFISLEITY